MNASKSPDSFTIERHGEVTLIRATPALESLDASLEQQVADLLMSPLRNQTSPLVVFDLSAVNFFGSMFVAVMLRCWKKVQATGGLMVLAGVSPQARELLKVTSLDLIWPMYPDSKEAIEALNSE